MTDFSKFKKISKLNMNIDSLSVEGYIITVLVSYDKSYTKKYPSFVSYSTKGCFGELPPYFCARSSISEAILFSSLEEIQENLEEIKNQLNGNFIDCHIVENSFKYRKFQLSNNLGVLA